MPVPPTGAIIAARIRKSIDQFIKAEAWSERSARTPEELGVRKSLIFQRLVNAGVFVETSGNRYFLHRENLNIYQNNRRKRATIALIVIFAIIILYSLLS
ncbi:MAG: hypothetical protein FD166_111 [Bacteroidetes bacterium]|nr:MAG: hypothetical protein FD166_111 [Bacteroidota bacterium]